MKKLKQMLCLMLISAMIISGSVVTSFADEVTPPSTEPTEVVTTESETETETVTETETAAETETAETVTETETAETETVAETEAATGTEVPAETETPVPGEDEMVLMSEGIMPMSVGDDYVITQGTVTKHEITVHVKLLEDGTSSLTSGTSAEVRVCYSTGGGWYRFDVPETFTAADSWEKDITITGLNAGTTYSINVFKYDGSLHYCTGSGIDVTTAAPAATVSAYTGVTSHTQAEIIAKWNALAINTTAADTFATTPVLTGTVTAGALSDATKSSALNYVNFIRYVAGLNADVAEDPDYSDTVQHGSVINALNGKIDHYPVFATTNSNATGKGYGTVTQDFFNIGYEGTSSSNLGQGYGNMIESIDGYMEDSDSGNIERVGHRSWVLNPNMGYTGFGEVATGRFYSMYSVDTSRTGSFNTGYFTWPSANMPIELYKPYGGRYAFSVFLSNEYNITTPANVKVTVTCPGKEDVVLTSANSDSSAQHYLKVNDSTWDYAGVNRKIIFSADTYQVGDVVHVKVEGLDGGDTIEYDVNFFSLEQTDSTVTVYGKDVEGNSVPATLTGGGTITAGQNATVVAPAVDGYTFQGWYAYQESSPYFTGEAKSTEASYTFKPTADTALTAVYKANAKVSVIVDGAGESFSVNGTAGTPGTASTADYSLGSKITLIAGGTNFKHWKNSYGMIVSTSSTFSPIVTNKETYTAVYAPASTTGKALVVFQSVYGQTIYSKEVTAAETDGLSAKSPKPIRNGFDFKAWNKTDAQIASDITGGATLVEVKPTYDSASSYTYSVTGGSAKIDSVGVSTSGNITAGQTIVVTANTAPAGKVFKYWKLNNEIISYQTEVEVIAVGPEMNLEAVFDTAAEQAVGTAAIVAVNEYTDTTPKRHSVVGSYSVPEGCEIQIAGFVVQKGGTLPEAGLTRETTSRFYGDPSTDSTYRYTLSIKNPTVNWYVRAYLVYKDKNGVQHTVYGDTTQTLAPL